MPERLCFPRSGKTKTPFSASHPDFVFFLFFYPSPFVPSGLFNNTLIIYILGDNGASAEGIHGTIDELLAENSLPSTAKLQIEAPWRLPSAFVNAKLLVLKS